MVRPLSVLFALLVTGCSSPTDPATDILSAHAENRTLRLANTSDDPVYFFAADKDALALLNWAICVDPAKCRAVQPHSTKTVPYSEIAAYQQESGNAVVYHWRIISKGSGQYDYDKLRALEVKLH